MRKLILPIFIILLSDVFLSNCANPTPPTGGAKDTIPPKLISAYPEDQTLNFNEQTITLTFDESINTDKIKQNLIITPITDINYKVLPKKETLTLRFEEPFEDSTTYTFNFFAGVTDITEKNPAENLVIAFSTTNYIDSLEILGTIKDLFSGKPMDKMTVGLYRAVDSLDLTSTKPTYFINTTENGSFRIQNIKDNRYLLLAFADENKNLLFDPGTEAYAFLGDTINLTQSITDSLQLFSIKINASKLNMISARPSGRYFDVRYSKPIINYDISFPQSPTGPASDFSGEAETIRFYNNMNLTESDSIQTILTVYDSLQNGRTDTFFVKFRPSSRKPTTYNTSIKPSSGTYSEGMKIKVDFSKPTRLLTAEEFLYIPIDTLFEIFLDPINEHFNFNHTEYSFQLPSNIKQFYKDTLDALKGMYIQTDTNNIDTAKHIIYRQLDRVNPNNIAINILPKTFASVEEDTTSTLKASYKFPKPDDFGEVRITLQTEVQSYIVQLMSKDKVIRQIRNCSNCQFNQVLPGNYWIRILIDENNDGKWTPGNFLKFESPEPIVHFPEESSLRANWQIELNYSF